MLAFLIDHTHSKISVSLFRVILLEVVGHKFNGVRRSFLGALRHGLQEDGHHSFIKVCAQGQILDGWVLGGSGASSSSLGVGGGSLSRLLCIFGTIQRG